MTGTLVACLAAAVAVICWPAAGARRRLTGRATIDHTRVWLAITGVAAAHPRRIVAGAVIGAALAGAVAGGPVAGWVGAVYAALAGRALIRRAARRRAATARTASLDGLAALAADLRVGQMTAPPGTLPDGRLAELAASVWRLAERTGAPAADLIERIEADARISGRNAASAAAQAAGAHATALLLAALPFAGLALGGAIGANPVRVLLHTPIGAACAVAATLLQGGGLWWADRLAAGAYR